MHDDLHKALNWRLLKGSHEFPGPDGGTCINEAAIVVAGLPYRKIASSLDLPPCFSKQIGAFAMGLNDLMLDGERHLLIPFVTRLAGSVDTAAVEERRCEFIALNTIKHVTAAVLAHDGQTVLASRVRACDSIVAVVEVLAILSAEPAASRIAALQANFYEGWASVEDAVNTLSVATANLCVPGIWPKAIAILDGALRIGKQADPIDTCTIIERAEAAKRRVAEPVT